MLVACLVGLLALPAACVLFASRLPLTPAPAGAIDRPRAAGPGGRLLDLPALMPTARGAPPRGPVTRAAIRVAVAGAIDRLLSPRQARELRGYLSGISLAPPAGVSTDEYPYRYRGLDDLLDRTLAAPPTASRAAAASDLASLLTLAAAAERFDLAGRELANAGQVAFALLHRARATRRCLPQLNLAFLVATSEPTSAEIQERELRAAERACPSEPTATWLLGQWQALVGSAPDAQLATFARAERRFPRSAAGWAGHADVLLRLAYEDRDELHRPFTARHRFARALALYRRAGALDPDPGLVAGEARALDGLGRHASAARIQAHAVARRRTAPLQARLVEYLERAGRFGEAATQAQRLAARPRFPHGPALFVESSSHEPLPEDQHQPLSLGAGRLLAVRLAIVPVTGRRRAAAPVFAVADIGFIPRFRDVEGVTGTQRWFPAWSARRDLVLAGKPAAALASMPAQFDDIRTAFTPYPLDARMLRAVAEAEAGHRSAGVALVQRDTRVPRQVALGTLYGVRQNLWRFAGRFDEARKVTTAWQRAQPRNRTAFDRGGEVAFLAGDHAAAAAQFGKAARLARQSIRGWSASEALYLVKRGAALLLAGHHAEALVALDAGDDVASRAVAAGETYYAAQAMYHARAQAADTLLRQHRFADAIDRYEAAGEVLDQFGFTDHARPEVLDNNRAIAEILGGRPAAGLAAARAAVRLDPMSPVFLQTQGSALERLGRPAEAARSYQRAVDSDPTLFGGWNDLGVALARANRDRAATAALRRAIGTRRSYAKAWFNLAIVLRRSGLRDAVSAQGALARAYELDPELRGRELELITDEDLYFSDLDLSKPLPPTLEFAGTRQRSPLPAAGLALILLLGLRSARAVASRELVGGAGRWLAVAQRLLSRLPGAITSFAPSTVAVIATVAVLGLFDGDHGGAGVATLALVAAGLLVLVALVMRVRVLAARRAGVGLRQRAWRPTILVALGSALAGVPWAALPVAQTDAPAAVVHRAGPVAAAAVGLVLLVLSAWLQVPLAETLGASAIVMAASMLTPIGPLDGAKMTGGATALTAALAVGGTAVLLLLRL